jgi:hypothetical protein
MLTAKEANELFDKSEFSASTMNESLKDVFNSITEVATYQQSLLIREVSFEEMRYLILSLGYDLNYNSPEKSDKFPILISWRKKIK